MTNSHEPLNQQQIDAAAALLVQARRENRVIDGIPDDCRPATLEDAYAVQDRLIELLGWPTRGWFCACTNKTIQSMLGLHEPYHARLLADAGRYDEAIRLAEELLRDWVRKNGRDSKQSMEWAWFLGWLYLKDGDPGRFF